MCSPTPRRRPSPSWAGTRTREWCARRVASPTRCSRSQSRSSASSEPSIALRLRSAPETTVCRWCERYQLQKIALVGHSLGAGTAALSTMLLHRHARPPPPAAVVAQQSSSKTSARSLMDSLSSLFRRNAATPSGETKADSSVIDGQAMAQPAGLPSAAPGSASARFPLLATRCFGFGPPACVAGDFGGLEQHIHSFVLGDDLVPRLTTATFQVLTCSARR